MNAAKRYRVTRDDGTVTEEYELVEGRTIPRKRSRRATRSNRELRLLRDKFWLLLSNKGMTPEEIAQTCRLAARTRFQIWRRVKKLKEVLAERENVG